MEKKILIYDGAMGTMLQKAGLQPGECPEEWNLTRPDDVLSVHQAYLAAGSDLILTNTFGGSQLKLQEYGLGSKTYTVNQAAANLAKRAACAWGALAVGTVGPSGQFIEPYGPYSFDLVVESFREQIRGLVAGGVDIINLETMADLAEMRAALIAARDVTDLPIIAQMTFSNGSRTVLGTDPITAVTVMEALGADVIGANCSGGPDELYSVMAAMAKVARRPLVVKPNAGLPALVDGITVFPATAADMAAAAVRFAQLGVRIIGGCCGNTPQHISAMRDALKDIQPRILTVQPASRLASRTRTVTVAEPDLPLIIGERINPTGKKKLAASLRSGDMELVRQLAKEQATQGAAILDVNVGAAGVDEEKVLWEAVQSVSGVVHCPLSFDTTQIQALEKALRLYPGKALINSVTGDDESLKTILPLAKRYGAAVIGLTMDSDGVPADVNKRLEIARRIVDAAREMGLPAEDIYLDCLVMTAAAQPEAVRETLLAVRQVQGIPGVRTVLGISNISHGLPGRDTLNSVFLSTALANGLDVLIGDPGNEKIQEVISAWQVLSGQDRGAKKYIQRFAQPDVPVWTKEAHGVPLTADALRQAVLDGDRESAVRYAVRCGQEGQDPMTTVDHILIPALETVGEFYEGGTYFLPQLLLAAEAAEGAFLKLKETMAPADGRNRGTVVLATVKGDIHDIGKNIVAILLENHGYRVVDLGKDVPREIIAATVRQENADIVGLSALMTTTMLEMEKTIAYLRKQGTDCSIIVGGAVVTPDFAKSAGADEFGADAQDAVRKVTQMMKSRRDRSDCRYGSTVR
jgi:5-methyltetrahydrofolate--homocysteine methyltransferase